LQQKPLIKNSHQSKRKTRQGYFPVEAATFGPLPPNSSEALYGAQLIGQKCLEIILDSRTSILYTPLGPNRIIYSYLYLEGLAYASPPPSGHPNVKNFSLI